MCDIGILNCKKNLDLLDNFFSQHSSVYDWYRPTAGFINFPRCFEIKICEHFLKQFTDNQYETIFYF